MSFLEDEEFIKMMIPIGANGDLGEPLPKVGSRHRYLGIWYLVVDVVEPCYFTMKKI